MELQQFINNFSELFDETEKSLFNADTRFKELEEWSSLTILSVIAMADEKYNTRIKESEIISVGNVGELYQLIKDKQS